MERRSASAFADGTMCRTPPPLVYTVMIIFKSALPALLLAAALGLTVLGAAKKNILAYIGGLLWAVAAVCALVDGAPVKEILATLLAMLCALRLGRGGAKGK